MVHYRTGDILDFHNTRDGKIATIAIPSNTENVMGKGIALQFKQQYPDLFETYKKKVTHHKRIGLDPITPFLLGHKNRFMIFPTKRHWRNKSKMEWIESGLIHIRDRMAGNFYDLALPPLGCGNGGLDWREVERLMIDILGGVHYDVYLFPPKEYLFEDDPNKSDEQNMVDWLFGS